MPARQRQQGFLLITVVVIVGVLAAIAFMLSANTAMDNALVTKQSDDVTLNYLAESGMEHAKWQLAQNTTCNAYSGLPDTAFGRGSYSATVTPTSDSPVSLAAVGRLDDGTTRSLILDEVTVYDRAVSVAGILIPAADGKDTYIEGESGHTDHNKGGDNDLKIRSESGNEYRTLIEFDLSALPPTALIQSAILELDISAAGSNELVHAHQLLRPWTESGATWETYDGSTDWTTPGGDYDSTVAGSFTTDSAGTKSMDISDVARAWVDGSQPNFGLILLAASSPGGTESRIVSSDNGAGTRPTLKLTHVCECGTVCTGMASGQSVILSTETQAVLGGLTFQDNDLADYDATQDTSTLFLDGGLTTLDEEINAIHVLESGRIVLSARSATTMGGLSFNDEDLVEYDPATDTATMYLDGSAHFADNEDIISLHVLNNGNLVLSTFSNASLGGVSFSNRDLIEYDPVLGTASIFFDGDAAGVTQNIGALHVLENGHLILGFWGNTTLGGINVTSADLVQYDMAADSATLYFPGSILFSDPGEVISSVHINGDPGPELVATLNVLFVVANPGSLTSDEAARQVLMESWGYVVTLIDDSDSQTNFDAAATTNDVVYVTQEIVSGEIGTKLRDLPIGLVDEEQQLFDEIGFGSTYTSDHGMRDIDIVDNSHEITSVFTTGNLSITSSDQSMHYLSGTLSPDLTVLAVYPLTSYPILAVLDAGDVLYGGGSAAARRVWLPWGGNIFQFSGLNADGHLLMQRAIEWAADNASAFGPIAHWKLDDGAGTAAIDSEGGHTGTLVNGPTWLSSGKAGGALSFDGNNDYMRVADAGDFHLADGTIQAWIKADNTSDEQYLFYKDGSDKIHIRVKDGEVTFESSGDTVSGSILANQWYLVTASFGSDGMKLYIDNNLMASSSKTDAIADNTEDIYIGADGSADRAFTGVIDDVRIYDRVLSVTEVADLFLEGGGGSGSSGATGTYRDEFNTDNSFAGDDGTLSWSTDWQEIGENDGAGSGDVQTFDDTGQYQLRIRDSDNGGREGVEREADLSACSSATLSFVYRRNSLDNSNDYVAIDVSADGGSNWLELDRLEGNATDSSYQTASYDISTQMATNTRVRFLGSVDLGNTDTVYFDDVEINCL